MQNICANFVTPKHYTGMFGNQGSTFKPFHEDLLYIIFLVAWYRQAVVDVIKLYGGNLDFPKIKKIEKSLFRFLNLH